MATRDHEWKRDSTGFRAWKFSYAKTMGMKGKLRRKAWKNDIDPSANFLSSDCWNWKKVAHMLEKRHASSRKDPSSNSETYEKFSCMRYREKCIPMFFRTVCQEKIRMHKIKVERLESSGQSFSDFYYEFFWKWKESINIFHHVSFLRVNIF